MPKRYSIAEARHGLAAIVHDLDHEPTIELTRRGQPVAVLLSLDEYRRLLVHQGGFWGAYTAYRAQFPTEEDGIDELLRGLRDPAPGREVAL